MKKITHLLFLFSLFSSLGCLAQNVSGYSFSQSTETYVPVAGINSTATGDDGIENNIPIGFPFSYGGLPYTTFSISTNGWIRLGATIGAQSWVNSLSNANTNAPLIAAFWDDHNRTTGSIQYAVAGTQPNRTLEVGWDNVNIGNGGNVSPTAFGSFKMRLHETTGQIEFIYGPTMISAGNLSASIGLNDATTYLSVWPEVAATASGTFSNAVTATDFVVGQRYSFAPQPACEGTPTPGNTTSTLTSTCTNTSFILGLENLTPGYGVTYQWFSSTNGVSFNPIANAISPVYQATQSVATTYKCEVTCAGSTTASTPILVAMNPLASCYCAPTYTQGKTDGDLISNVVIPGTTLSNNTGTDPVNPYYTYFSGQENYTASLEAGVSYAVNITVGTYENQNEAVWVDYNDDGIFTLNERVGVSGAIPANGTGVFNITLACDAPLGVHRMRIRDVWNTNAGTIDPCANYGYGEVEDYDITITATTSCQVPVGLTVNSILSDTAQLEWEGVCDQNNWDLHITLVGGGEPTGNPSNPNVVTQVAVADLQPGTTYEAYVRGNCGANGYSGWSAPITFTTLAPAPANDDCDFAQNLIPGETFEEHAVTGTNVSATKTTGVPGPSCATFGFGGDVWYSTVVPADGNITLEVQANPGSLVTDTVLMAFTGSGCSNLTVIGCDDEDGIDSFSRLDLTGLTPGETIYARVWEYANDTYGSFRVSAWSTTLANKDFTASSFKVYPNPVKDVLEVSATEPISKVDIHNVLGQQVLVRLMDGKQGKIDMSALPQGTYVVRIFTDNETQTLKVIKQ